jgi:hypothetical protein
LLPAGLGSGRRAMPKAFGAGMCEPVARVAKHVPSPHGLASLWSTRWGWAGWGGLGWGGMRNGDRSHRSATCREERGGRSCTCRNNNKNEHVEQRQRGRSAGSPNAHGAVVRGGNGADAARRPARFKQLHGHGAGCVAREGPLQSARVAVPNDHLGRGGGEGRKNPRTRPHNTSINKGSARIGKSRGQPKPRLILLQGCFFKRLRVTAPSLPADARRSCPPGSAPPGGRALRATSASTARTAITWPVSTHLREVCDEVASGRKRERDGTARGAGFCWTTARPRGFWACVRVWGLFPPPHRCPKHVW